jgi:hypothetical protein
MALNAARVTLNQFGRRREKWQFVTVIGEMACP